MSDAEPVNVPTRQGYDRWAGIYDDDGNPLVALEELVAVPLLGPVGGLRAADIGCGTGRHALRMAAAGADVVAADFSAGMLAAARAKPGAERVRWVEHDLAQPLPLDSGAFDRVVCALVLDHVTDVRALMGELRRIVKPAALGGFVLITVMHPAMLLRGVQARFTDPGTGVKVMPASVPNQLSDYVMGAVRAGLTIEHLSEHAVDAALVSAAPRAERHMGWPMLVAMTLTRG